LLPRILIAWEIGGYYGHFGTTLPIAYALRNGGYEPLFATPDTKVAAQALVPRGFPYVQSPRLTTPVKVLEPPGTYAEALLTEGYGDFDSLLGRVVAWQQLFRLWEARLLIVDHAPTALLAARAAGLPSIQVGHGFFVPPAVTPLPAIRPWEAPIEPRRVEHSEAIALNTVNKVLAKLGAARSLDSLTELFTFGDRVLTTFAELDHFDGRVGDSYAGALFGCVESVQPGAVTRRGQGRIGRADTLEAERSLQRESRGVEWEGIGCINIFAYIHENIPGLHELLSALSASGSRALCVVPQLQAEECRRLSTDNLTVSSRLRNLQGSLSGLDLVICGGIGVLAQALLAAVPVLLLPANLEQLLLGRRAEAMGAGVCIGTDRHPSVLERGLRQALDEPAFRAAAAGFARRYVGFDPSAVVEHVVGLVHRRLGDHHRET
jgi:UDP:flavonoid glycosyltransferase YjiC (YdhE family)